MDWVQFIAERVPKKTYAERGFDDLRELFWRGCPQCERDEAEGGLVNHCDKCCRKITEAVGDFVQGKLEAHP